MNVKRFKKISLINTLYPLLFAMHIIEDKYNYAYNMDGFGLNIFNSNRLKILTIFNRFSIVFGVLTSSIAVIHNIFMALKANEIVSNIFAITIFLLSWYSYFYVVKESKRILPLLKNLSNLLPVTEYRQVLQMKKRVLFSCLLWSTLVILNVLFRSIITINDISKEVSQLIQDIRFLNINVSLVLPVIIATQIARNLTANLFSPLSLGCKNSSRRKTFPQCKKEVFVVEPFLRMRRVCEEENKGKMAMDESSCSCA